MKYFFLVSFLVFTPLSQAYGFVICPNWDAMNFKCSIWKRVCPKAHETALEEPGTGRIITCFRADVAIPRVCFENVKENYCPEEIESRNEEN